MKIPRVALYTFTAAYWVFILVMTHIPKPPPPPFKFTDKIAHLGAFGILGGLLFLCAWSWRPWRRMLPLFIIAVGLIYGALDELTQPWFGRTCDFYDWLFDAMGVSIAVASMFGIRWLVEKFAPAGSPQDISSRLVCSQCGWPWRGEICPKCGGAQPMMK